MILKRLWARLAASRLGAPLLALALLDLLIFSRLLFTDAAGTPHALIPWDFRSIFWPWMAYLGDSLRAGHFPLWCPYVRGGTPFFLFGQNQLWSPLTLLLGSTFGYSLRGAQLQQVVTLFAAGAGACALAWALWEDRTAALIAALCYGLSSTLFGNLEHGMVLFDYAVAPWLFWAILRAVRGGLIRHHLWTALLIDLSISGGYPFVAVFQLGWAALWTLWLLRANRERTRALRNIAIAWSAGIALAAPAWLPLFAYRHELSRAATASLEGSLAQSARLKDLWGLLFGFLPATPLPGDQADITNRCLYLGSISLPLIGVALLRVRKAFIAPLLVLALGCFWLVFAQMSFLRIALHVLLPFLRLSQQPGYDSRYLLTLALALLAAGGAGQLAQDEGARRQARRGLLLVALLYAAGLAALHSLLSPDAFANIALNYGSAELLLLLASAVLLWREQTPQPGLLLAVPLALQLGTTAVACAVMIGQPIGASEYQALRQHERTFTAAHADEPRLTDGLAPADDDAQALAGYTRHRFYLTEYNGFRLARIDRLVSAGFADWMRTGPRLVGFAGESAPADGASFVRDAQPVAHQLVDYQPNQVDYRVDMSDSGLLVFNEVYFAGWEASIDAGPMLPMRESAAGLRALSVPSGAHLIHTQFRPRIIWVALGAALLALIGLLLWAVRERRYNRDRPLAIGAAS